VASPELIGREPELAALSAALDAAHGGHASLTFVAGEAGVGKTRLLREVESRAQARGMLVLHGDCLELRGGELPYAPVVAALRDADPELLAGALARLPADARAELTRLVPDAAAGLPGVPDAGGGRPSSHAQGRLYELLLGLLRHLSADRPLLLAIEDGHWADQATRDFVAYLARNAARERIALTVTYRSDELHAGHPLRPLMAELLRWDNVERLSLRRLERDEVERLLDRMLGRPAERELLDAVFGRSNGNPFFCEELVAAWQAGLRPGLPERVRDVLLVRLEGLSPEALTVVRALSAIGRPAGDELVGGVAGLGEPELSQALRAAVDAHILTRRAEDDRFGFRHALMREVARADLMPGERKALHARIAAALAEGGEGGAAELAFHLEAAGNRDAALGAHAEAARQAERVYAWGEALAHHERSLALLGEGDLPPGLPMGRLELLRHAADAARFTGDYERAVDLGRRALALVDPGADPVTAAVLHERLGEYTFWDDEAALASYAEALALLPASCEVERARVMGAQALALHYLFRWPEARASAEEALATARRAGARAEEAYARITLGTTLAFLGDPEAGEAHVRAAERIVRALGRAEDRLRVASHLGEILRLRGRFAGALAVMEEGEALAAQVGMSGSFGRSMGVNAAEDLVRLGRWAQAAARLEEAGRLDLRYAAQLLHHSVAGQLAAARGDGEEARASSPARGRCAATRSPWTTSSASTPGGRSLRSGRAGRGRPAPRWRPRSSSSGTARTRCTRRTCSPSGVRAEADLLAGYDRGAAADAAHRAAAQHDRGSGSHRRRHALRVRASWSPRPPRPRRGRDALGLEVVPSRTAWAAAASAGGARSALSPPPTSAGGRRRRSGGRAGGRTPPRRSGGPGTSRTPWARPLLAG
jgi:tetratricopeptide (TPR) repeat protein